MKNISVGIIGKGNVGSELYKRVLSKKWTIEWTMGTKGFFKGLSNNKIGNIKDYPLRIKGLDLVFLTIPTLDDGKTAFNYIKTSLNANVPIVTCEKGALSNYYSRLEGAIKNGKIGYSATVGGGSRLLRYLRERMNPQVEEIHAVVNGTLNYIFEGLSQGRSLGEVVEETKKLGYTEPMAENPLEIINQEAVGDVPMKTSILFNSCNLISKRMVARDIQVQKIEMNKLKKLEREASSRRYIVSITKDSNNEEDVIWGFKYRLKNWYISAGFKHIENNPLFRGLIPSGVNNAVLISEGKFGRDGSYVLTGPGAGVAPTSLSMLIDAERILL